MVYDKVIEILKEVKPNTDFDKVSADSDIFTDLRIDSFTIILLAICIEDEFKIRFEGELAFRTLNELCDHIETLINEED